MLQLILILLLFFWLSQNFSVSFFNFVLFYINRRPVTLWNFIIFLIVIWAIGILPQPLRNIAIVLLLFWLLSLLGVIVVSGLSNIILPLIILGIILHLIGII